MTRWLCGERARSQAPPLWAVFRPFIKAQLSHWVKHWGGEHLKWVHPSSPNARYVWRSQLLALFSNSIWYSWSCDNLCTNLQSLLWNLVLKGYPLGWWKPQFLWCWDKYRLHRFLGVNYIHGFVREGRVAVVYVDNYSNRQTSTNSSAKIN